MNIDWDSLPDAPAPATPAAPEPINWEALPDAVGTAESYANLAKRGALPEGLWAGDQGLAELPRTLASVVGAGVEKFAQLKGDPELLARVRKNRAALRNPYTYAAAELAAVPVVEAGDWLADAYQVSRDSYRRKHPVSQEIAESLSGQFVQGLGQAVPTTLMGLTMPQALPAMAAGQIHQEALDDARQKGATDDQARLAAAAYLPAATLDYASDRLLIGKLLKPLVGKVSIGQAVKHLLAQAVTGGVTEATQQVWLNAVEKAGFKPNQTLTDGVRNSFLVGTAVDGATTAGGLGVAAGTRRLAERADAREAAALARWASALGAQPENPLPATETSIVSGAKTNGDTATVAGNPLPINGEVRGDTEARPAEVGQPSAGTPARPPTEIDEILAAEKAQIEAQRAEAERRARADALQQRPLPDLMGEALRPRVADLAGKTDLEKHDFWQSMQGLAQTLAGLQTTTTDGQQARRRQLSLEEMREQAGLIFPGAQPELLDALALKLHGSKPAESVAALRDFYRYAGQQRAPYAAAAQAREAAVAAQRQAEEAAARQRQEEYQAAKRRAAQERARIRDTGRDLEGRVVDWTAVPDTDLERLAAEPEDAAQVEIAGARAEIERRANEQGAARPLTRDQQIRLLERYGGINPDHPVHRGELATIRESDLGKNRKLWRADGASLDRIAEALRQEVQNGPETEADVLAWLSELAAGRAPKLYERGDLDNEARYAAAARRAEPLTEGITREQLAAPVQPVEAPPGAWTVDNRVNNRRLRDLLDPLAGKTIAGIEIPRAVFKHAARLANGPEEFRALAQLAALVEHSAPVGPPQPSARPDTTFERRVALALVDGKPMRLRLTIRNQAGRRTLYHLENAERPHGISQRYSAERKSAWIGEGVPLPTVADLLPEVKPQPDGTATARFAAPATPETTTTDEPLTPQAAKAKEREERRMRRVAPRLFADVDVRIAEVERTLRQSGYEGEIPDGAEAVYLPRLRAEKDLMVVGLDTILRGLGLPRMLHEGGHAYWRMLSQETREALGNAYQRDLREQWSPLWRDGELSVDVSQQDILSGSQLGLEEWFSELMAAVNHEWAKRRSLPRLPGWIGDIAAKLRDFVQRLFNAVADHKGLQGDDRLRFLTEDFRAFLTRGQSFQRTAQAGAQFARSEARYAEAQALPNGTAYGPHAAPTREVVAWARRHLGTAEFRRRAIENNYVENDPENANFNALPNAHIVEQVARDALQDYQRTKRARFAAPQQIISPKQSDATPTAEDKTLAARYLDVMPAFQGGKYQMAEPAAAMIRQHMPETERAKIESIVDYFGGGGWWGSYLALTHFPNVRRITVNEFDPLRAAKIRLLHEAPDKVTQFLNDAAVREALQQVREKAAADEKTSGWALAARLHILPEILPDFPPAAGLAGLLKDAAMSARGRAEDAAGAKTAAASLDKLVRIALRDAKHAAEGAAELRRRGVVVEVVQGDAYARSPETGDRTLAVFDPPYYLTTGYDGGIVPLGIYEKTAAALQNFAASGNAILYTDSGWWLDAPEKAEQTADIFSGEQADRAALFRIVDSLNAVGIVPVEGRHEIIGINRPGERHGLDCLHRQPGRAEGAGSSGQADRQLYRRRGGQTAGDQTAGSVDAGASGEARSVPAALDARERFEAADAKVRELEAKLAALAEGNSQENDVEEQGAELQRQLIEARRERNHAQAETTTADSLVYTDPVSQELAKDPTVRSLRAEKQQLTDALATAKKENQPTEALLDRRDAINADLETIRRQAEQGTFPLTYDPPVAFGDANPPRTDTPPKPVPGAAEPDHLRPKRILSWEPYTDAQLTERLARLRQRRDAIGDDDLEAGRRLSFLADLVRDTREELEARRAALELQAEHDAIGEAKPAHEAQTAGEDEALAREKEQDARATLDAEAAAAIPDAPEESFPVRENVEEVGAQVSAATLEPKSGLRKWLDKLSELLRGFRSAVPELPTFKGAERFATFREGLRLLHGLDEVVRKEAEEAVADIVAPLQAHSTIEARSQQARLQELRRQAAASPAAQAARAAEIAKLEKGLQADPWWIFQNVVLYGDLFTRSRLYRRDDGSPISLPGGLNPAEAEHLFKTWLQRAHAHPQAKAIMEARERHKAFVQRIAEDLKVRGFVFAEGANTNYFPHVMLENWDGDIAHVKAGTAKDFRGYLVTPTGSAKPIETDYFKAMYYHAVQVLAHNKRADILRDYVAREDIKQQLVDEAAQARRRDPDAPPVNWRQIFHTQYADKYALYSPDPDEIPLHPELVIDRDALAHRLGVVLGNGPLQEELKKAGMSNLPLKPSEIQEMLVAGSRELWVLPKEVAEALRGVSRRAKKTDNLVTKLLAGTQGLWKRNILFAPWNWLRFEFNNIVSDGEKVLVSDPAMAAGLIDAGRDVYAFISGSKEASDDVREAFRLGVLDTLTAAEVQALRAQRPFEAFETRGERATRVAVNRLTSFFGSSRWNTMGWSKLREATFRFAKYKADLERMRHGATPRYGGAYWKNVEALQRVGAPEAIHEQDRTGRLIGRQGPGTGPQASAKPYALAWEQGGRRFEESYATRDERTKKREALEAQQRQADTELVARKAAAISRATFGDYGELTPNGNWLRRLFIPFFAWTEVNFRYHANLLRNMRDMLADGRMDRKAAAGQIAKQAAGLGARAAMGLVLSLALPYLAIALWNSSMFGDDEDDLSEEDRRRFHLLLGRDDDGKIRVVYLPTAFSDVLKWFSGNRAAALVWDVVTGRTDWETAAEAFGDGLWRDALNNTLGSAGPVFKIPYTLISRKSTFPDVTDQRTIPSYDMRRVVIGQMSDQFTAEMLELAINRDYVASRDVGEWAQQAILQVRRRDPESWAFYAIKDKAAQFEEAKTGRREQRAAYDAPDAQVLRQFRRAIYQADVPTAVRMYQRLLELGYTAERFESSVRAQDPLYGLPKAQRDEFVRSLNAAEREQLRTAYRYYLRIQEMEGSGRRLFPSREASERTRARYQTNPRLDVLHDEIQRALSMQQNTAETNRQADQAARKALR